VKRHSKPLPSRPTGLRPEDAPLGSLESRAAARAWLLQNQKRFQIIFDCNDETPTPLNLENSTCDRQIWPDGSLFELIMLDGRLEDLTEAQLQDFIDRHPIKRNTTAQ
jgi:hypothetical protein